MTDRMRAMPSARATAASQSSPQAVSSRAGVPIAELVARLRKAAETSSRVQRGMMEAKSLHQDGNTERRTDLYFWPEPEQTIEGQAADRIEAMREALEACELMIVTAGNAEFQDEPCRVIHENYAAETLVEIWKHIPSHVERDPEMATLGKALNTPETPE